MKDRISQSELESYLWGAATLLRGKINAGEYKTFIFPLLFLKRLSDVYDEEFAAALVDSDGDESYAARPAQHRFQIPSGGHWSDVRATTTNVGASILQAIREIEDANPRLSGVFGDAPWTNKHRLPDVTLRDLIEHCSTVELSIDNVSEDELGLAYEFLVKKFADDFGHTAAEFYTNRTLVYLMTRMLSIEPGDTVYDPTCGSGGMLVSAANELRRQGKEHRTLRLYGQELNPTTAAIAAMNLFLHGIEDFEVLLGDTLANPAFVDDNQLHRFDVILANPPYSVKSWDRAAWPSDKWSRNLYGIPPQGRADYAFWQHIIASMNLDTGRCAILFPHGVLFRDEEADMRKQMIEADIIDAVIGVGPNLFYNSSMEACVVICRAKKPKSRRGSVLFIDASDEVTREGSHNFLNQDHQDHIAATYLNYTAEDGYSAIATISEIATQQHNLSIPRYVTTTDHGPDLTTVLTDWRSSSQQLRHAAYEVLALLDCKEGEL